MGGGGRTTDVAIVAALAERFRIPLADLSAADPRAVTVVPEAAARRHRVIPMSLDVRAVTLATSDPRDLSAEQALEFITGRTIQFALASPSAISEKLDELYRLRTPSIGC